MMKTKYFAQKNLVKDRSKQNHKSDLARLSFRFKISLKTFARRC